MTSSSLGGPVDLQPARSDFGNSDLISDWLIRYDCGGIPPQRRSASHRIGALTIQVDPACADRVAAWFADIAKFELDFANREVSVCAASGAASETVRHVLADQVFPRILAHQGELVLHASAVQAPMGAVLLMGESGSGKSTLGASLHFAGWPLLGDDAIVISSAEQGSVAQAVYRSLRLFPDSVARVLDASTSLAPVAQNTAKQKVVWLEAKPKSAEVNVRTAFLLDRSPDEEIRVQELSAAEACMAVIENSFALDPTDARAAKEKMIRATRLAMEIPMYRLTFPRSYSLLGNVREMIDAILS